MLNVGKTNHYFKLKRGTQQGDTISTYLFIQVLEIAFTLIKANNNTEGLDIFNHNFLYTAYAGDTTFFIKNINPATEIIKTLIIFLFFLVLKLIKVKLTLRGMECVNLNDDVIRILGIYYS